MTHLFRPRTFLIASVCAAASVCAHEPDTVAQGRGRDDANRVRIFVRGEVRHIEANGIPDHATGRFPNRGNPNSIRSQNHNFRVPANPQAARRITPLGMHPFGVAINGIPFDPGATEWWNRDRNSGWRYEALSGKINLGLDSSQAHVQPSGAYHYHGLPTGLVKKLGGEQKMALIGYAADGFPIYAQFGYDAASVAKSGVKKLRPSYQLKKGTRPGGPRGKYDGTFVQDYEYIAGSGDLDKCNGRTGVTPEYPDGTYYYVVTETFPFIPRYFRGTPGQSFMRRRHARLRSDQP